MQKIYFIIHSLAGRSGTERVTCQLANLLDSHGYQVVILNMDTLKEKVAFPLNKNIEVQSCDSSLIKLIKIIKSFKKNDILFIQNMERLSLLILLSFPKTKVLCLEHGVFFVKSKISKFLISLLYSGIDYLITITYSDAKNYKKFIEDNKITTIYNSTPYMPEKVSYNLNSKKIVALGRLSEEKNFSDLVLAWSYIYNKFPDWSLEIYGDGEEKQKLETLVNNLDIKNIFFLPNTNDVESVYKNASFLVQTSKFEGLGMVLIEAQSFGLPVIAYDCPYGPSEIISDNSNGFLIELGNVILLSNKIEYLITHPEERLKMSHKALTCVEKFSPTNINRKWLDLFKQLEK